MAGRPAPWRRDSGCDRWISKPADSRWDRCRRMAAAVKSSSLASWFEVVQPCAMTYRMTRCRVVASSVSWETIESDWIFTRLFLRNSAMGASYCPLAETDPVQREDCNRHAPHHTSRSWVHGLRNRNCLKIGDNMIVNQDRSSHHSPIRDSFEPPGNIWHATPAPLTLRAMVLTARIADNFANG